MGKLEFQSYFRGGIGLIVFEAPRVHGRSCVGEMRRVASCSHACMPRRRARSFWMPERPPFSLALSFSRFAPTVLALAALECAFTMDGR